MKMQESKLFQSYTVQEVLDELDVIECFEVSGNCLQIGEATKHQMELYTKLGGEASRLVSITREFRVPLR